MQTVHFYDRHTARFFHDNGSVLNIGNPANFTVDNTDSIVATIERTLKASNIIGQEDSLSWVA